MLNLGKVRFNKVLKSSIHREYDPRRLKYSSIIENKGEGRFSGEEICLRKTPRI